MTQCIDTPDLPVCQQNPAVFNLILIVAAVLRFTTLATQSLWADEGFTAKIAASSLRSAATQIPHTESTPPLFYVLLWFWAQVFGTGEAGLRSFPALCSTLTIPVVWLIGRRLVSDRVGLIAALITAFNAYLLCQQLFG